MKPIIWIALLVLSTLAVAQTSRVVFENDKVRVLVVSYAPGEKTKLSDHQSGLQIALTDRKERLTSAKGGVHDVTAKPGQIESGLNGQYATENLSSQYTDVMVVELKNDVAGASADRLPSLTAGNEASATATLRTLNTAEVTFASIFNRGFTESLHQLGAPGRGRDSTVDHGDLVDPTLSGFGEGGTEHSFIKNGYRFTYTPGPGAVGLIASYRITAEPLEHGFTGTRSFFTDQSAVVRATPEKRPATARDNPI